MKYCSKCGNRLKEEDVFCSGCGAKTSVYGVYEEPEILTKKKVVRKGTTGLKKTTDQTIPGARYTAAVEKNAIAVTEYLSRAMEIEWQKYQVAEVHKKLEAREGNCLKEIEKQEEAIKSYTSKLEQTEKKIKDYKKLEYRRKVYNFKLNVDPLRFIIILGVMILMCVLGSVPKIPPFTALFGPGVKLALKILLVLLVPVIVEAVIQAVKYVNGKKEHEKLEDEAKVKYEEEQDELEKNTLDTLHKDKEDFTNIIADHENEKARLQNINLKELKDEIALNEQMERDIKNTLETYYSTHVLDPKYQDLVPVTTTHGYFKDSRCTDLTGHEGAYSLYEKELKAKTISGDLAEVLARTGNLADGQKGILSQVGKVNGKTEALIDSVDRVNAKNMSANPKGNELSAPIEHSRDLENYYSEIRRGMLEHLDYVRSVDYISRRWF